MSCILPFVVSLVCLACGRSAPSTKPATSEALVDNTIHITPQSIIDAPLLTPAPDLILGADTYGDEDNFGEVAGMDVDDTGRLYVIDHTATTVKVFDRSGSFVRRIGRKGNGPGEFPFATYLTLRGDTLFAQGTRLHAFDTSGVFIASSQNSAIIPFVWTIGEVDAGIVLFRNERPSEMKEVNEGRLNFYTFALPGRITSVFSLTEVLYRYDKQTTRTILTVPPAFATSKTAGIYHTVGDSFHIVLRSSSGVPTKAYVARLPRIPATDQDLEDNDASARRYFLERRKIEITAPNWRRHGPVATHRPAIETLLASEDGRFIVKRLDLSERPYDDYDFDGLAEWQMFKPNGKPAGRLKLPAPFKGTVFTGCAIYGKMVDNAGVPLVMRYTIDADWCK